MSRAPCYSFAEAGSCRFGDNCRFSHDASGESIERPPQRERRMNGRSDSRRRNRPDFKSMICRNMKQDGVCKYGDDCRFSHDMTIEEQPTQRLAQRVERSPQRKERSPRDDTCFTFRDHGSCKFGDDCRFRHGSEDTRDLQLLKRRANGVCYSWRDNGECKFEDRCRFAHEHLPETTAAA